MTATREAVLAEARTWLRTPWRHMGDLRGVGVDCVMLLARVYGAVGAMPAGIDPRPYPIDWHLHRDEERYATGMADYCDEISESDLLPADIVLYRVGRCYSHAGIVMQWPQQIIHAYRGEGVVISSGIGGQLGGRPRRYFRARGIV